MESKISRRKMMESIAGGSLLAAAPMALAQNAAQSASPNLGSWDKPFDIHVHVEQEGNDFADIGSIDEMIAKDYRSRVRFMDSHGIATSLVSPGFRYRKAEGIVNTRKMNVAAYVAKHSDRFPAGIGTVEVSHGDASLRELERMAKDLKLKGVAWHHADSGQAVDHPFMRPLLKQAQELKLIPFIHVREKEYEAWWRLEVLAEEFPGMTFVAFSGMTTTDDRTHAAHIVRRRQNILVDTGPVFYGGEGAIESFVKRFGAGRLLFGSNGQATLTLQAIRNSQLSVEEKTLVLAGNARKLLNMPE
jgi:predicted TIM-barrel fold metal-dependent hydrolase